MEGKDTSIRSERLGKKKAKSSPSPRGINEKCLELEKSRRSNTSILLTDTKAKITSIKRYNGRGK